MLFALRIYHVHVYLRLLYPVPVPYSFSTKWHGTCCHQLTWPRQPLDVPFGYCPQPFPCCSYHSPPRCPVTKPAVASAGHSPARQVVLFSAWEVFPYDRRVWILQDSFTVFLIIFIAAQLLWRCIFFLKYRYVTKCSVTIIHINVFWCLSKAQGDFNS